MSEPYMTTPLCQYPGCDRPWTGIQHQDGLAVCYCQKHAGWAFDALKQHIANTPSTAEER